jgi:hypothetical protein
MQTNIVLSEADIKFIKDTIYEVALRANMTDDELDALFERSHFRTTDNEIIDSFELKRHFKPYIPSR